LHRGLVLFLSALCAASLVLGILPVAADKDTKTELRSPNPATRRMAVLGLRPVGPTAIPSLEEALSDRDPLVRRAAASVLASCGARGLSALSKALDSPDFVLRRNAALYMGECGPRAIALLAKALHDEHPLVRQGAVHGLCLTRPPSREALDLLAAAGKDTDGLVTVAAVNAIAQCFEVIADCPLPEDRWKFKRDPNDIGRREEWYRADLDDGSWDDIGIGKFWQDFGHDYEGIGWYRRTIRLPENPGGDKVMLHFGAVDEATWLWINGQYVGENDIGPSGWDKAFRIDAGNALKWGQDNQVTVRVLNTAMAGGIWKPVSILVMMMKDTR